jgi:hypothetical protein
MQSTGGLTSSARLVQNTLLTLTARQFGAAMPSFLSDPPFSVYLLLALLVFVTGGIWSSNRTRRSLCFFLGAFGLLVAVLLLDTFFESPREESVRRVQAMMKAANDRDTEAFVNHLADTVQYRGESANPVTFTRDQIRKAGFWNLLRQHNVTVAAWDFSRTDVKELGEDRIEIGFLAKGEVEGKPFPVYFRATFSRQSDGQMKLSQLASFDPLKRQNAPMSIPQFP